MIDASPAIAAQIEAEPTLDELMRRRPHTMSRADRDAVVRRNREQRAAWELKQQQKADKKAGLDTAEETATEGDAA